MIAVPTPTLRPTAGLSALRGVLREHFSSPDAALPCALETDGTVLTLTADPGGEREIRRIALCRLGLSVPLTADASDALLDRLFADLSSLPGLKREGHTLLRGED